MSVRLASAAAACMVLAGCGSVTSDINFQAPTSGWFASPPILGRTQVWIKRGDKAQTGSLVFLMRGAGTTTKIFQDTPGAENDARLSKDENVKICGNEPAEHVVGYGKTNGGTESSFEGYIATVHGERYVAVYVHPRKLPADPEAEAAIRSLCPKPT